MVSAFHQLCLRYSDTLTPTARTVINGKSLPFYRNCCEFYASSVDTDQTMQSAASDLCLHCLHIFFLCGLQGGGGIHTLMRKRKETQIT